jgi:hypothetical protein
VDSPQVRVLPALYEKALHESWFFHLRRGGSEGLDESFAGTFARTVMSNSTEIDAFFDKCVFGFISSDVQREIDTARRGEPAGNWLAALGLWS